MKYISMFITLVIISSLTFVTFNFVQKAVRLRGSHVSDNCYATIVTAYYKIPSKHSSEQYLNWMKNLLSMQDCMVVYTTEDLVSLIRNLRPPGYPLKVISYPLDSFKVAKLFNDSVWINQESMDPELEIGHSRELYWIWNEKTTWLHKVSRWNPFHSEYFAWLDIGAVRNTRYNGERLMQNFPFERGVLLLQIEPFTHDELTLTNGLCQADFSKVDRIGGGMIGGDVKAIDDWNNKFYQTLIRYVEEGRFAGKDQSVMATSCIETNLCLLVPAFQSFQNKDWFFLQHFFRGSVLMLPTRLNLRNIFYY